MEDYDLSMLYLPPKKWDGRAEEWCEQVDNIIKHVREQIAQDIELKINGIFREHGGGDTEYIPKWIAAGVARGK